MLDLFYLVRGRQAVKDVMFREDDVRYRGARFRIQDYSMYFEILLPLSLREDTCWIGSGVRDKRAGDRW